MSFDFAALKSDARRALHDTLGVSASYQDASMSAPETIKARWHNKIARFGDLENQGYADVVEGVDRIVLFPGDTPDITFVRNGIVTFPGYGNSFRLEYQEPSDGPLSVVWQAVRV